MLDPQAAEEPASQSRNAAICLTLLSPSVSPGAEALFPCVLMVFLVLSSE